MCVRYPFTKAIGSPGKFAVKVTNIDWIAYMQQIESVLGGERDYLKIRGDTGPLVFVPAFDFLA